MTSVASLLVDFEEATQNGDRLIENGEEYQGFIWTFDSSRGRLELTTPRGISVPQAYSLNQEGGEYIAWDQEIASTELNLKRADSSDFYFTSGAFAALDVTIFFDRFTQINNDNSDGLQIQFVGLKDGAEVVDSGIIDLGITTFGEIVAPIPSGFSDTKIDELIIRQAGSSSDVRLEDFVLLYDNLNFSFGLQTADPITGIVDGPGTVKLSNKGVTPFTLFGSDEINVSDIKVDSLIFGGKDSGIGVAQKKNESFFAAYEDVNEDGELDLVVKVQTSAFAGVAPSESEPFEVFGSLKDETEVVFGLNEGDSINFIS